MLKQKNNIRLHLSWQKKVSIFFGIMMREKAYLKSY